METPRFAVVLSGCGVFDGSEIHEAVCALLAIDEAGCAYQCFAPNTWQAKTVDHFTGEASAIAGDADNRNVLAESARIARGNILDLSEFNPKDFDAIIFPGGFGAAMNWSSFAVRGPACEVNEEVERALNASYEAGIAKMGAVHQDCGAAEVCVDEENKIVTVPAYMLSKNISQIAVGAHNLVSAALDLIEA